MLIFFATALNLLHDFFKKTYFENELSCNPELDFDGNQEILIGTYGELVLVYKEDQNSGKWSLKWSKNFNNPVHNIFHLDFDSLRVQFDFSPCLTRTTGIYCQVYHRHVHTLTWFNQNFMDHY